MEGCRERGCRHRKEKRGDARMRAWRRHAGKEGMQMGRLAGVRDAGRERGGRERHRHGEERQGRRRRGCGSELRL